MLSDGAAYLRTGNFFSVTDFDDEFVEWGKYSYIVIPAGYHKFEIEGNGQLMMPVAFNEDYIPAAFDTIDNRMRAKCEILWRIMNMN